MRQHLTRKRLAYATIAAGTILLLYILWQTWRGGNLGFGDKTLWDWMELLIIPFVLAAGGLWFNYTQKQTEMQIARDRREQELLQSYFDRITTLLLEHNLREKRTYDAEEHIIGRARTLAALRNLGDERKGQVLRFLIEAGLVQPESEHSDFVILSLSGADLRGADLKSLNLSRVEIHGADLSGADLRAVHLSGANLNGANLSWANLENARLIGTSLNGADLSNANLSRALLRNADLTFADLSGAELSGAYLGDANLGRAKVSRRALDAARIGEGTTLPDVFLDDPRAEALETADESRQ